MKNKSVFQVGNHFRQYSIRDAIRQGNATYDYLVMDPMGKHYYLRLYQCSGIPEETKMIAATKDCDYFMQAYDWGEFYRNKHHYGFILFDVEEFCHFETLGNWVQRQESLKEQTVVDLLRALTQMLIQTEKDDICYTRITPDDIMVTHDFIPDFEHTTVETFKELKFFPSIAQAEDVRFKMPDYEPINNSQKQRIIALCLLAVYLYTGKMPEVETQTLEQISDHLDQAPMLKRILKEADGYPDVIGLYNVWKYYLDDIEAMVFLDDVCDDLEAEKEDDDSSPQPNLSRVVGMNEVKTFLERRVIYPILYPEKMKEYKVAPINGILLYGPPGTGKTYLAESIAGECEMHYMAVRGSDMLSQNVHGQMEKMQAVFEEASQWKHTLLHLDEMDLFCPVRRGNSTNNGRDEDTSTLLTYMTNCGEKGIFIVGTTNRPDAIDPAILRTGRIDKMFYIGMPDLPTRADLLAYHLSGRPMEGEIDYHLLGMLAEGMMAADIRYFVDELAVDCMIDDKKITQQMLCDGLKTARRSITPDELKRYTSYHQTFRQEQQQTRSRIGFC